ncbi:MAG: nuclear transport factor 2 family protein [Verrucomicrobia bacterium]|nr:nuclear transport factor 2 family protein [Verrucomicrobiota bacterium]
MTLPIPIFCLTAAMAAVVSASASTAPAATQADVQIEDKNLQEFLSKLDSAQLQFHNGQPAAVKALWSHADDVTVAGGAGGKIEKGWSNVSARLDWASSHFSHATQSNERVAVHVAGNFAYVVQLEHIRFRAPRKDEESRRDYRVTMVFRRESDGWRIVHRQADTMTNKQVPQ